MKRFKKAYLEITNVCNLACSFCPGTKREKRFMSVGEFEILAGKLRPYTDYLYFHLMGEPLCHPQLPSLLKIADELGFKVIITTNGTLLAEKIDELLNAPPLHRINISLQSFEGNGGDKPKEYLSSCARFALAAAKEGKLCTLRLWNKGGAETLNDEIYSVLKENFPGEWEPSRDSLKLCRKVFLQEGEKFDWPDFSAPDYGEKGFCYALRDQIGVLVDGTVVPCCLDREGSLSLGNLFKTDIDDIMSTERAKKIYEGFSRRTAREELCRHCGYARRFD